MIQGRRGGLQHMSSIITDRIHAAAAPHVGTQAVPGLVALVLCGGDESLVALGHLDVEPGRPARRDSLFRITSTTKPITAAATLALVGEGVLSLEEPVDRLLPELAGRRVLRRPDGVLEDAVPAVRAITVRDLLTFTFGFGMVLEMFTAAEPWPVVAAEQQLGLATFGPPDPSVPPDPDTWIARLGSLPLLAQPGERWMYNSGAAVLGVLLARAAGAPLGEVLRTRLFDPLAMRDTGFWTDQTERLATAYRPTPDGLISFDPPAGRWSRPPMFPDAAAGLVSTVDDLAAFARMLLAGGRSPSGQRVLSAQLVRAMTSDQLTPGQKAGGGLGPGFFDGRSWGFCQAVYDSGAYGWDGGFGTSWLVDPARELAVIVLTQRMFESPATPQLHRDIQAAVYAAI
jgi:CubicO group peptidase (beta-lactamase class C family)